MHQWHRNFSCHLIRRHTTRSSQLNHVQFCCLWNISQKSGPNSTHITIGVNRICYPGDTGANTASLELFKITKNRVLSRQGAKFTCFDVSEFYLGTLLNRPEYFRIKIYEYNLTHLERNKWVYFNMQKGGGGLPQSVRLTNDQLFILIKKYG